MTGSRPTDEELVLAFQESESADVLEELLRRHLKRVRSMIYQMVLDDAAADDLTQDVFHRTIRGLPQFDGRSLFSTWLYRIVKNTTYRFLEQEHRQRFVHTARGGVERVDDAAKPQDALMERELSDRIAAAIGELSPPLRAAVVLVILQDMSTAEAAEIEGCASSTIYWRIHQARKLLGNRLSDYLQPDAHPNERTD